MEDAKLKEWLKRLCVVFNFDAGDGTLCEYLRWLSRWKLSDPEWEKLMELAVHECRYFPTIAELAERKALIMEARPYKAGQYEIINDPDGGVYVKRKTPGKETVQ